MKTYIRNRLDQEVKGDMLAVYEKARRRVEKSVQKQHKQFAKAIEEENYIHCATVQSISHATKQVSAPMRVVEEE